MWKTGDNDYGCLPALRQLLSSSDGSRMAISTRDRNIASEAGHAVEFGPRATAISQEMFLGYFGDDDVYPSSFEDAAQKAWAKYSIYVAVYLWRLVLLDMAQGH